MQSGKVSDIYDEIWFEKWGWSIVLEVYSVFFVISKCEYVSNKDV